MTVVYEVFNPALERQLGPSGPRKQKPKGGGGGNVARSYAGGVDVLSLVRLRQTAELARAYGKGGSRRPSPGPSSGHLAFASPPLASPPLASPPLAPPFPFPVPPLPVLSREAPLHERRREHPREPLPPPVRRRGALHARRELLPRQRPVVATHRSPIGTSAVFARSPVALQHLRQLRHLRVVVRPQGVHLPERALQRPRRARVGLEVVEGILREERRRARARPFASSPPLRAAFSPPCARARPGPGACGACCARTRRRSSRPRAARGSRASRGASRTPPRRRRGARACAGRRPGAGKTRRDRRRETRRARGGCTGGRRTWGTPESAAS